ncbi:MAG: NlpC/P60 family protein [Bacteroidales bacterium]
MRIFYILCLGVSLLCFSGCGSTRHLSLTPQAKVAAVKLGIPITRSDYQPFFVSASDWLGVPYRTGGTTKRGADCSGFVFAFYRDVFQMKLSRNSSEMFDQNCVRIRRKKMEPGDLVFFNTGRGRKIDHVGIYLKDNKFIHTSSSRGVMVSDLNDPYFKKSWKGAGRVVR